MKKYGAFSGWFKLSGTRGRLSFLFSSLITYILFSIIYLVVVTLGLSSAIMTVLIGNEILLSKTMYILFAVFGLILIFDFWVILCIEIQRLRDIGFNKSIIFSIILIHYLLIYFYAFSRIEISFYGLHWALIMLLLLSLFELFMPSNKNTESKKVVVVSDSKSKRIDPKL